MKGGRFFAGALAVLVFVLASTPSACQVISEAITDDLSFTAFRVFDVEPGPGETLPLVFEFTNHGQDRVIRVVVQQNGSTSAAFSLPGNRSVRHFVYLPALGERFFDPVILFYEGGSGRLLKEVEWNGLSIFNPRLKSTPSFTRIIKRRPGATITGTSTNKELVNLLTISKGPRPGISHDFCTPHDLNICSLENPDLLPDSWLAFKAVDVIVIPSETWSSSLGNAGPLLDWIALGGVCIVLDAPLHSREAILRNAAESVPFVEINGDSIEAGLGRIEFLERRELSGVGYEPGEPFKARSCIRNASLNPPPAYTPKPPFLPVLFFLSGFSILAGPGAWWYVVGRKKKALLYYTLVPLLSVAAIVFIVGVDFFKHGFFSRATCWAVELIDQNAKKRITLSQFVLYTPFSMGKTLQGRFNEQPHFLSLLSDGSSTHGFGGLSINPGAQGVVYSGSAVAARRNIWYGLENIQLERRRLAVWKEGEKICVENHLGSPLNHLVVCCHGEYALFDRLGEGEKGGAVPIGKERASAAYIEAIAKTTVPETIGDAMNAGLASRWHRTFLSGRNTYAALRSGNFEELTWIDSARFSPGSFSIIRGVY